MPDLIGLAVPAYFHPALAAADWAALADSRVRLVVFNVDSGAGTACDPELAAVASQAADAGASVIGYVDTAYGTRSPDAVEGDLLRYREWYGLRGTFFDQVSAHPGHVARYRSLAAMARTYGSGFVVFNHGVYPDAAYADLADLLVTFEGPWSEYRRLHAPSWAMGYPPERFCHLVYAAHHRVLGRALQRAAQCNVGVVYITDRDGANPWDGLPGYFEHEVSMVANSLR